MTEIDELKKYFENRLQWAIKEANQYNPLDENISPHDLRSWVNRDTICSECMRSLRIINESFNKEE